MADEEKKIEGTETVGSGKISVKIARLGKPVDEADLDPGATLADALEAVKIEIENVQDCDLRINNAEAYPESEVKNQDIITIIPPIEGGY